MLYVPSKLKESMMKAGIMSESLIHKKGDIWG